MDKVSKTKSPQAYMLHQLHSLYLRRIFHSHKSHENPDSVTRGVANRAINKPNIISMPTGSDCCNYVRIVIRSSHFSNPTLSSLVNSTILLSGAISVCR